MISDVHEGFIVSVMIVAERVSGLACERRALQVTVTSHSFIIALSYHQRPCNKREMGWSCLVRASDEKKLQPS